MLISDYCCGEKPWTPVFEAYVKQRGYILYTPSRYGKVNQLGSIAVASGLNVLLLYVVKTSAPHNTKLFKLQPFADNALTCGSMFKFLCPPEATRELVLAVDDSIFGLHRVVQLLLTFPL